MPPLVTVSTCFTMIMGNSEGALHEIYNLWRLLCEEIYRSQESVTFWYVQSQAWILLEHPKCSRISLTNYQNGREKTKVDLCWIVYLPHSRCSRISLTNCHSGREKTSGELCICHGQCMSKWSRRSTRLRPQMCRDLSHQLQKCQKYIKSVSNRSATSYIYRHSSIAILRYKNLIISICKRISKKSYQANPEWFTVYICHHPTYTYLIPDICFF